MHDRACDREPLSLTTRYIGAPLSDFCIESSLKLGDKVFGLCDLECRPQVIIGGLFSSKSEVGGNGSLEQKGSLRYEAECLPHCIKVGLADIHSADLDSTACDIKQARYERDHCGFTGTG